MTRRIVAAFLSARCRRNNLPVRETLPPVNSYTHPLTSAQAEKLRGVLVDRGFTFSAKPYTIFFAQKDKLSVAVYEKGPKVLLQGKGIEEFVQFALEPEVLGEAKLGYEEVHSPEMFEPHFGVDESGKGDFFGPLVDRGCVCRSRHRAEVHGCRDSGQQTHWLGRSDSGTRRRDSKDAGRGARDHRDRTGEVQHALREIRES
jgi:ribonuclease HIII